MSIKEEVDVLRNIPLFSKIEPAKLKLLAFTSERVTFESGQTLFQKGEAGDAAYIVMEGAADILIPTATGSIKVATLGKHAIIGEIAILCDVPRTATVVASENTVTLKINKDTFFRLVTEFPAMSIEIMRELAHRLEKTNEQLRATVAKLNS